MKDINEKISEFLKIEFEQLDKGISEYSSKITKITAGSSAFCLAIVWFAMQKPEYRGLLSLIATIGIHVVIITTLYYYIVYRTIKETKRIQAERINSLFNERPILIWEEIWKKIWGTPNKLGHSKLAWLIFFLFVVICILFAFPTIWLASNYIVGFNSNFAIVFYIIYLSMMILLPYFEIRIARKYILKIGMVLNEFRKSLRLTDEKQT